MPCAIKVKTEGDETEGDDINEISQRQILEPDRLYSGLHLEASHVYDKAIGCNAQ